MVRKNKEIKGISINGKEYKLSQYADDTQLILDGTEKSLKAALNLLKQFYIMSGLKINVDKQGHYGLARRVALLKLYVKNLH